MNIGNIPTMEKAHGVGTSTADVRLLGVGSTLGVEPCPAHIRLPLGGGRTIIPLAAVNDLP